MVDLQAPVRSCPSMQGSASNRNESIAVRSAVEIKECWLVRHFDVMTEMQSATYVSQIDLSGNAGSDHWKEN